MPKEILARAQVLNRRIYASLPWGYRIAQLFVKLSYSVTDTFGKFIYAQFALAGVEGLPPIKGQDALSMPESLFRHPERLPTGYGKKFADHIYGYLLKKLRNPEKVEEVFSDLLLRISHKFELTKGVPVQQAEAYVFRLVHFVLAESHRSDSRREHPTSLDTPYTNDDGDEKALDLEDPSSFRDLEDLIPQSELNSILRAIGRIDPKALDWFKAQLEGVSNRELAEMWGVSAPRVTQIVDSFEPDVKRILQKHLQ